MKKRFTVMACVCLMGSTATVDAQQRANLSPEQQAQMRAERERAFQEEVTMVRPIEALNSVWIEELTWLEIRDAIAAGKTTVIIPTGGIEQNGPYVAMGKHNYVLQGACEGIARRLGDALCAPIIKLVPEGGIEEPSGHMRYSGTISLREETFRAVLDDVASSLKVHGFENIVFIGDSGGNQTGMEVVANQLNERWGKPMAHFIGEFYNNAGVVSYMHEELGVTEGPSDGYHDTYWLTAMQMSVDPESVRYDQRVWAGKATTNGVSIAPKEETIEIGRRLMEFRIKSTVEVIRRAISDRY